MKVFIIGAGTMGSGMAQVFATNTSSLSITRWLHH